MVLNNPTNRYATSAIIVAPTLAEGAMFTTIGAAITYASANSLKNIFIKPGTYTENLTDPGGLVYAAYGGGQLGNVQVVGKWTQTGAISSTFSNIYFKTNSDNALSIGGSGTNQSVFNNCYFYCASTGIAINNSSASPVFNNCLMSQTAASTAIFSITSSSQPTFNYCNFTNDSGGAAGTSTIAAGTCYARYCRFDQHLFTTSSTGAYDWTKCSRPTNGNTVPLTTAGTGTSTLFDCFLQSGTSAVVSAGSGTTVNCYGVTYRSTNSDPFTGSGSIFFASSGNNSINIIKPGAYPYTMRPQDEMIAVDTSSARTINLMSSPPQGKKVTIKDDVGSAATNNITVSPAAGNIDGSASFTINIGYASIDLVYNGTQWNVK